MKKLYLNIALFMLPVIGLLIVMPVNERAKFLALKDDCFNHGVWVYDRIFNNSAPVDIAFLGSSHTINGINEKAIEESMNQVVKVANFGYCRLGRNINYVLLKKILEAKRPKGIVLEVREEENRYSHPVFPYIADEKDVLMPVLLFNKDILTDIQTQMLYKIDLTQDYLFQKSITAPIDTSDYGFSASRDTAKVSVLTDAAQKRSKPKVVLRSSEIDFYQKYPRAYLSKINSLCKQAKVKLIFLYLPAYGTNFEQPREHEQYLQYGEMLVPPKTMLNNTNYWHDDGHLNQTGAHTLSFWIGEELQKMLSK